VVFLCAKQPGHLEQSARTLDAERPVCAGAHFHAEVIRPSDLAHFPGTKVLLRAATARNTHSHGVTDALALCIPEVVMSPLPRLHLVPVAPSNSFCDSLFLEVKAQADGLRDVQRLQEPEALVLAQYIDLADARRGDKGTALYRRAMTQLGGFVLHNFHTPSVRALCGGSSVLYRILDKLLELDEAACEQRALSLAA
jgi:hypothetical protein